jgi:hypothetical protein
MSSIPDALDVAVSHHTRIGDQRADAMLGFHSMPFGYALLLDADGIYFRWLRYDGLEGPELLTMWSAYHSAKWNSHTALSVVVPMPVVAVPNC